MYVDGGERPQNRRPRKCLGCDIPVPNSCSYIGGHGANSVVLNLCLTRIRNCYLVAIRVRVCE